MTLVALPGSAENSVAAELPVRIGVKVQMVKEVNILNLMLIGSAEDMVADLVRICEALGHYCSGFSDVGEALKVYGREPQLFDAVILDATQPEIIGITLIQKLRCIDSGCTVMLIIAPEHMPMVAEAVNEQVHSILWQPISEGAVARALFRRGEELELQRKSRDEQAALVKEYIKLKREFGEAQILLRKYEALLESNNGN